MAQGYSQSVSKQISANELGITGSHQAGIVVPKSGASRILEFFPPLDPKIFNPSCIVTVKDSDTGEYWDLRFVHYNNKIHGRGTRNEYRLTGMTKMFRDMGTSPGDHVVFTRTSEGDVLITTVHDGDVHSSTTNVTSRAVRGGWTMIDDGEAAKWH
ncbi:EcoRII N-terminal effector-binding domain-containing protein [Cryobacterium sp. M15]|uniref:EcoRII N-terminal effector-binding domain-containing protein n=1 Tax=Cryobacterium sp. M15 TaxID=2048291 RepID=UPI000CE2F246|nr:EcoRII N-terminal effector-binding domain-containing protein [Cryobacterium sp. M15]